MRNKMTYSVRTTTAVVYRHRFYLVPLPDVCTHQSFDDDYIPPNAVELSVILVDPNFAKTAGDEQPPAGVVFDKIRAISL